MSSSYTVFYGTFIQLPRILASSGPKHVLDVNHGALWVSSDNGRIEGFDWDVETEEQLDEFLRKQGWVVDGEGNGEKESVKLVKASEKNNGFFFPGFIGTYSLCEVP